MKNFWQELKKKKNPFFALAPMEGATDSVFRQIISSVGKPDVFFTEFTSVEGLFSKGASHVERRLIYTETEHPLIAQIWGLKPELYYKAAKYLTEKGFDGIDINMGCPAVSETSKGACAALIKNPQLAKEIIQAAQEGTKKLPVSVKTRLGFSFIQTEEWIGFLLEQNLDALTIHGRTRKEMSKVPAHWDEIEKAVRLRKELKKDTVIIGNGDVKTVEEGNQKAKQSGVDGIMIGRGVFENAWLFSSQKNLDLISIKDRISLLKKHLLLYEEFEGKTLPYHTLKKYFKIYVRDFDGAGELRSKLMETNSINEAANIINPLLS